MSDHSIDITAASFTIKATLTLHHSRVACLESNATVWLAHTLYSFVVCSRLTMPTNYSSQPVHRMSSNPNKTFTAAQ
jgi:hypothetical protein